MDDPTADDTKLMADLARGDTSALGELVRRHQQTAASIARRMLGSLDGVEDVVQEAYLRVFRSAARYRPAARFSTWLYRIVVNLCHDRLRRDGRRAVELTDRHADDSADDPPTVLEAGDAVRRVRQAVDALPRRQRTAVILHRYQQLSHAEIAATTGWSVSAVESLLVRAYQRLRRELADLE